MEQNLTNIEIINVDDILNYNLEIPNYQRPYKWTEKNVIELLEDINHAIKESKKIKNHKYRIGTIILHKENNKYYIVDGQQRLLSLALIKLFINKEFECNLIDFKYSNEVTKRNIYNNYYCIKNWFNDRGKDKTAFEMAFRDILEVVVIVVNEVSIAFQLFDSQNTRGKSLKPHDILKAYHLRKIREDKKLMQKVTKKWESISSDKIDSLFNYYLFPILNWCKKEKATTFSVNNIDYYKGVDAESEYTYAERTKKASPIFQITEPFISGSDFFKMVEHYIECLDKIKNIIETEAKYKRLYMIIDNKKYKKSAGFSYATNLFWCALLCYYDRFNKIDLKVAKMFFEWAYMIRIDLRVLGEDSINKYAIGEENYLYTNNICMFSEIVNARTEADILNLRIITKAKNEIRMNEDWEKLYKVIKSEVIYE